MRKTDNHIVMTTDLTGIPRFSHEQSMHDMVNLRNRAADIVCLQGMDHFAFWAALVMVFNSDEWDRFPRKPRQDGWENPICWRKSFWDLIDTSHCNRAHGLNAVLLQHKDTHLKVWVRNTRYPVDDHRAWNDHNERDLYCLQKLATTGYPVLTVGNYHRADHMVLGRAVGGREVNYIGAVDDEYVMMLDGLGEKLVLQHQSTLPEYRLFNTTGARSVVFRLTGPDRKDADV